MGASLGRWCAGALVAWTLLARPAAAQSLGGPCDTPGQLGWAGFLLTCGESGTYRYALHDDVPPAPEGGYTERPEWYPRLSEVLRALDPPACPASGRVTFTHPVVRLEDLLPIIPQGAMVGDHVTPIDHGYIGITPLAKPRASRTDADYIPVYAPADAEVLEISLLGSPRSIRIVMAHGCEVYSIHMVLNRLSGALAHLQDDLLARGRLDPHIRLLAGTEFAEGRDNPPDFSVHDGAQWLSGLVSPFSYTTAESWKPYTVDPWPYFSPDLAAAYEAKMQRLEAPRWGRIDYDIAGTAAGNWFLAGTVGYSGRLEQDFRSNERLSGGVVPGKATYAWSHLAIARHSVQPSRWIFSIGWWADARGDPRQLLLEVRSGQPQPSELTTASGVVVYRLWTWTNATSVASDAPQPIGYDIMPTRIQGLVAIQVNADETLGVEVMPGAEDPATFRGFTPAKRLYRR
ncbi:MAG: hypothetical protein HYU37_20625 [Acidobacteria bacterium]|nr:hypothetical protein [Acidobacteriota bacterium]